MPGNAPQSTAHGAALLRASQFKETGLDRRDQSRWDEIVAEGVRQTGQRRQSGIGPFIDIVFRHDHPARRVVEAQGLSDARRDFGAQRIARGRCMGDRQQHDVARTNCRIGRGYILQVPEHRRELLLDEAEHGESFYRTMPYVSEPVPAFDHSRRAPLAVLASFEECLITHIADGKKGQSAGTGLVRLHLEARQPLERPVPFEAILLGMRCERPRGDVRRRGRASRTFRTVYG